jgi:uncharacterized membrane protein
MTDKKRCFNDRVAMFLTTTAGSMPFFWFIINTYIVWMLWNGVGPSSLRFDGEWFPLLLFISNMIQLLFLPILQVGQNMVQKKQEKMQRHIDSQVDKICLISQSVQKLIETHENSETHTLHLIKQMKQKNEEICKLMREIKTLCKIKK